MNATLFAMVLWGTAGLGITAAITAIRQPQRRRPLLIVAALLFLPIGVMGILSVGALFLAAAAACVVGAVVATTDRGEHAR